jgi:CRISPR-associated protein Cas1
MLNEFAYCPRLFYLEWVQGDFRDNADTVDGRRVHRRVDKERGEVPAPSDTADEPIHARSVYLSAPRTGLIARIDLLEGSGAAVTPVDYKRGKPPDTPEGAWEPERVQVCAQALVLEENGFTCTEGVLYFAEAKRRVSVPLDDALRARTLELLSQLRETATREAIPPPLVDSPKCPRCSLVSICLPDEVNLLALPGAEGEPRRLIPARDDALPVYVQEAGTHVGKNDELLSIRTRDGETREVRLNETSQLGLFGAVQISTQAVQALCGREIPIAYFSHGGWFYGLTQGGWHKNVELRVRQYRAAFDPATSLTLARRFVSVKIRNARTLLRRNHRAIPEGVLDDFRRLAERALAAEAPDELLGVEGTAGRIYFEHFAGMLSEEAVSLGFDMDGRNRRPPRDPVNALLSLAYSLLTKDFTLAALAVGFDPFLGFYHRPRYGRPALALDLMEEFRPLVADSIVLQVLNSGMLRPRDFVVRAGGTALAPPSRARFLEAYERRMDELVTHPVFEYRVSYRRVLEVQSRLLARHLAGEISEYPAFLTR